MNRVGLVTHGAPATLPLIAWCLAIFTLSSFPGTAYPQVSWPFADKLVHFSLYAGLGICAALCFAYRGYGTWVPVVFGMVYGISDELHQLFIPLRSCSAADWVADCLGVIAGVLVFRAFTRNVQNLYATPDISVSNTSEPMELT